MKSRSQFFIVLPVTFTLWLTSCSKETTTDSKREDIQETRLRDLEAEVTRLRELVGGDKKQVTSAQAVRSDAPSDEVVINKLFLWQDVFSGKIPGPFKRGDIAFANSAKIPNGAPIFPIRVEFEDGSSFEMCLFQDGYREWKSFPKGNLDTGLR